jgi:MFS family permease
MIILFLSACLIQSFAYGLTFLLPDLFQTIGGTVGDVGETLFVVGLVTVLTAIGIGRLTHRFGQLPVLCCACLACGLGLFLLAGASTLGTTIHLAAILLGFGWAGFYILGPIILARVLDPSQRVRYFSWLAACIMAGIGGGPFIGYFAKASGYGVGTAFFIAGLCSFAAAMAFLSIRFALRSTAKDDGIEESPLSWQTTLRIFRSKAWRPVVMVTLGASVFAAVFNFQTIYANDNGLAYPVFFGVYTVTVLVGRFCVAAYAQHLQTYASIAGFLTTMTIAVLILIPEDPGTFRYVVASFLFAIGYGLAYPIVKSMAANDAETGLQDATLQLFGLGYFVGLFGFPFLGAAMIESFGFSTLLWIAAGLAAIEAWLATSRYVKDRARSFATT